MPELYLYLFKIALPVNTMTFKKHLNILFVGASIKIKIEL